MTCFFVSSVCLDPPLHATRRSQRNRFTPVRWWELEKVRYDCVKASTRDGEIWVFVAKGVERPAATEGGVSARRSSSRKYATLFALRYSGEIFRALSRDRKKLNPLVLLGLLYF